MPQGRTQRTIKAAVLKGMSRTFEGMYSNMGRRPSIPVDCLLKSQLLIAIYSVWGGRMFCENLDYNILYLLFLDMNLEGGVV